MLMFAERNPLPILGLGLAVLDTLRDGPPRTQWRPLRALQIIVQAHHVGMAQRCFCCR